MAIIIKKKAKPVEPATPKPVAAQTPYVAHVPVKGEPKECTWCKHVYMRPCDGDKSCPNYEFARKAYHGNG